VSGRNEIMVGLVIIAALAVGVVGSLWLQGTNFGRPTTMVEVLIESVGQLSEGNVVKYRGVRIGQVAIVAVEPDGGNVRITMLLDRTVQLPEDAGVVLGPESLFGDWQAEIVSRAAFPRYDFYDLPDGTDPGVLPGYPLPEMSRLTASAEQISDNLADLTQRLELAFNQETADNLASAIANIEAITEEVRDLVRQQSDVAASVAANADTAFMEIEVAATAARRSFERVDELVEDPQLDSLLTDLGEAMVSIRALALELSDEETGLSASLARGDSAFVRLDRIAARLEAGEGSLGRLLTDTTFAVRAEDVLQSLDRLLEDVRENPGRYVRLSIF